MTGETLFIVALPAGAAILALWVEVRWPSLAPERLSHRFVAMCLAAGVLNFGSLAFERMLALPLAEPASALLATAVLLVAFTFAFLTAVWLLRSLQSLSAMR